MTTTIVTTAWPADKKKMGDRFGVVTELRKKLGLGPHRGLDFAVPAGTPLKSVGTGRVTNKGEGKGLGFWIEIRVAVWNPVKMVREVAYFEYDHLKELPSIEIGAAIKAGDVICHSGNTGSYTSGDHLHIMAGYKPGLATSPTVDPLPLIMGALEPRTVELPDKP